MPPTTLARCPSLAKKRSNAFDASSGDRVELRCYGCEQPFEGRRADQRYCSPSCRTRALARRRLEAARAALANVEREREYLVAEIARWEAPAAGRRQR